MSPSKFFLIQYLVFYLTLITTPLLLQCQRGDGERGDAGVPCRPGRPPRGAQVPRQRVRRRPLRSSSRRNGAHPRSGSDGLLALHQVDGS